SSRVGWLLTGVPASLSTAGMLAIGDDSDPLQARVALKHAPKPTPHSPRVSTGRRFVIWSLSHARSQRSMPVPNIVSLKLACHVRFRYRCSMISGREPTRQNQVSDVEHYRR